MNRSSILMGLCLLFTTSFRPAETLNCRRTGLTGHVYFVAGNQMPSPDNPPSAPKGIRTTLFIYELTNMSQVSRDGATPFYKSISTRLVKSIETGEDGSYSVKLKPGRYSLFVKKDAVFFANLFDGENNIHPVEVKKGKMTEEDFKVNYNAVY